MSIDDQTQKRKLTRKASRDLALDYIDLNPGRYIFPIKAGAKFPPLIKNNLDDASNDPKLIEAWAEKFPGCNWAVAHRKSNLMVIDVDTKEGKGGQATFDDLDLQYGFPATEMTRTPSGGFHLIYEGEHIFALGKFGFGDGVDSPNYTILAGSAFSNGTKYVAEGRAATAKAPAWFYEMLASKKRERNLAAGETAVDLDKPENVTWAKQFLAEDAEIAIEGKAGDAQTLKIAMGLRDRGISQELAFELMRDLYNERCQPPWELEELERKVANGFKYANQSRIGDRTAEADFESDRDFDDNSIRTEWTPDQIAVASKKRETAKQREEARPGGQRKFLSKKEIVEGFAYIGTGFDIFISLEDPALMWKPAAFDRHFKYVQPKGKLSDTLLLQRAGGIERFNGLCYMPGKPGTSDGKLNLYRPPNVVPIEGDTSWWNDHLEYLFPDTHQRDRVKDWLAWFLQNLDKKPKHALMMQGQAQGTGKSFVAKMVRKIVGDHNARDIGEAELTSQFNGFAMNAKLLVVEELRAVERAGVKNKLHPMISEDSIEINQKNIKTFYMQNVFGLIVMTNADAAISLDKTDRRYLVVRTDAVPKQPSYYVKLYAKLDDPDAISAVAYELMNRDLGDYSGAGPAPQTEAKLAMIEAGAPELEQILEYRVAPWIEGLQLISIEDEIIPLIPTTLQSRNSTRSSIKSWLTDNYGATECRAKVGDTKPRLLAINGFDPNAYTQSELGQFFMNRNVPALAPPQEFDGDDDV